MARRVAPRSFQFVSRNNCGLLLRLSRLLGLVLPVSFDLRPQRAGLVQHRFPMSVSYVLFEQVVSSNASLTVGGGIRT